jgi:hypothetical protein
MLFSNKPQAPAKLRYGDGEYQVLKQGTHVLCAVTGEPIPLEMLKYWNVERQEAYSSVHISFQRERELKGKDHND